MALSKSPPSPSKRKNGRVYDKLSLNQGIKEWIYDKMTIKLFGGSILSSLRVIARNEAIQTKSERRRPVALTPKKPPQAADGNGTLELLTVPSP